MNSWTVVALKTIVLVAVLVRYTLKPPTGWTNNVEVMGKSIVVETKGTIASSAQHEAYSSSGVSPLLQDSNELPPPQVNPDYHSEAATVQAWRDTYNALCKELHPEIRAPLEQLNATGSFAYKRPRNEKIGASPSTTVPCPYTFLDLGANVGDTINNFISYGLPVCAKGPKRLIQVEYNVLKGELTQTPFPNALSAWLQRETPQGLYPESFCVFGVEGNPLFTERLHYTQQVVMQTSPKPVIHLEYLTESVLTDTSGPTTLYIDTIGESSNFDGSSILKDATRIKQSRKHDKEMRKAHVMGVTLPELIDRTFSAAAESILLIKMDIEGAEYQVLSPESADYLCNLARKVKQISVVVEEHKRPNPSDEQIRYENTISQKLLACGVRLEQGDGG